MFNYLAIIEHQCKANNCAIEFVAQCRFKNETYNLCLTHSKSPIKRDLVLVHVKEGLTYKQARGLEQLTIDIATLDDLSNIINSIAENNPARGELLESGSKFADEFLKLIGLIK
jgi:hypothetical protein